MTRYLDPQPIPVTDRYYATQCENCGWKGSSGQCSDGGAPDYDDVICARCHESIRGDDCPDWDEAAQRWKP